MEPFVHLHVHTEYSLLTGACRMEQLMAQVKANGQTACAITDSGVMYGVVPFYQAAKAAGIHPVIGCEIYVAARTRFDKDPPTDLVSHKLTLLCENNEGYRNLMQIVSKACVEGLFGRPRADRQLLEQYHSGLIALSGGRGGEVSELLLADSYAAAKKAALRDAEIFGAGNYYLEVTNHGLDDDITLMKRLMQLSAETGIPLCGTNDVYYPAREDAELQKLLFCIGSGTTLSSPSGRALPNDEYYLKSAKEMYALFAVCKEAAAVTAEIAARCQVELTFGEIRLPKYTAEGVTDTEAYFRQLCTEGLHRRYGAAPSAEAVSRMEYEIGVITRMGYTDYFLIVWDFVHYAKSHDIPVGPGRGSGAGSLCAYCIGITDIDPLKNGLLFERFLNPERVSMPDFDIDFCIEGRQRVIDYVTKRYGEDRVAQIIAFDTLKARAAVRDTGRAAELPYALCDRVAKLIPQGPQMTIAQALAESEELRNLRDTMTQVRTLLEFAQRIEGMPRHATVHAAGVVISAVPIAELVPLQQTEDAVVTQYTMTVLEQIGLLKMDFLGLRNLTVIRAAERSIQKRKPDFRVSEIPEDEPAVYRMLGRGDSIGVFQMESDGLRRVLKQMQPENLADLTAVISLYRPGPMDSIPQYLAARRDPAKVHYDHPLLEPILRETFGCIVYQEQVMEICRTLAGYSYGRADLVRRAMAKKKHDVMAQERSVFLYGSDTCCGAIANGVPEETAAAIFDRMAAFASYAFNKSHAAAYARVAYETAYLKSKYPREYYAALLTSVTGYTAKLTEYLTAAEADGIRILPPHVNHSEAGFSAAGEGIRFGLDAVKGLGSGTIRTMIREREENGPYRGLQDFCERISGIDLSRRSIESLIRAGAFDGFGWNRRQMLTVCDAIVSAANSGRRGYISGQLSLFGGEMQIDLPSAVPPDVPEYPEQELLKMEKDVTGSYLSGHPLSRWRPYRPLLRLPELIDIGSLPENRSMLFLCMIAEMRQHITKKGEKMCYLTVEDFSGQAECLVFQSLYASVSKLLIPDAVIGLNGKISKKNGELRIFADGILTEQNLTDYAAGKQLCCKLADADTETAEKLLALLKQFPGETPVCFWLTGSQKYLKPKLRVQICNAFYNRLTALLDASQCALIDQKGK